MDIMEGEAKWMKLGEDGKQPFPSGQVTSAIALKELGGKNKDWLRGSLPKSKD